MQNKTKQNTDGSRRKLLKSVAAGSGAILAGKSLPDKWASPVVNSVILPAHAQTSPASQTPPTLYALGDTGPCGGIVFYILNGGLTGLEVSPTDLTGVAGEPWGCFGTPTGATGTAIGAGVANTAAILAGCTDSPIAAEIAFNYSAGGCTSGWYLPSTDELTELYNQRAFVSGLLNSNYWSSSEFTENVARYRNLVTGSDGFGNKTGTFLVRAIRGF